LILKQTLHLTIIILSTPPNINKLRSNNLCSPSILINPINFLFWIFTFFFLWFNDYGFHMIYGKKGI
jgi:hypothetical protein